MKNAVQKSGAQKTGGDNEKPADASTRVVPLIVPHGGAGAGSDFESAFEVVRGDGRVHELWRGEKAKQRATRT